MKPTLLLFPGLLCDAQLWAHQTAALADDYHCVVADMTQDDSLRGMVERAISSMPDRFCAAGLSMGGYAAFELMRQAPERVERLALLDTSARNDPPERIEARRTLAARALGGEFEDVIESHFPSFVHPSRLSDAALMATIRASAHAVGPEAYARQQTAIMNRPDSRDGLAAISCPTLVLCGAEDALTPPALHHEIADGIAGAHLVKVDGSGHLPTLEKPAAVTAAMRNWLELN